MLKKSFTNLLLNRNKSRSANRKRRALRGMILEQLESRQLMAANIASGWGTYQYAEDLASDFGGMVVDINNDGAPDVIGDSVYIRNGNGWLTYANGPGVGKLVDLDGDNDLDVLRGRYWVENVGGGQGWAQHEVATIASGVVHVSSDAADFDRDGDLDIVISRESKSHWFENVNGNASTWTEHTVISGSPFDFVATAAGDMDNDGDMDVVVSADDYVILWLENLGRGAFVDKFYNQIGSTADDGRVYTSASTLNVGDFDQDGRTDLIAVDTGDNTTAIRWFTPKEDPTSTFRRTTIDRLEWADSETMSVDIDNDGQLELVVTSRFNFRTGNDSLWVYERTNDFEFTRIQLGSDYIGPIVDSGDLDGDGDLDLVGKNFVFWNTGGDFHVETTDVSPIAIASGRSSAVLRIDATHNGQFGDEDILLKSFSLMVDDGTGEVGTNPLDSSTVAKLFDSWRIYLDDGDGIFMGSEDLLVSVAPAAQNGVVQVDLTTAAATLRRLHPEETRSFFLEVDMGATAHEYGDSRITNLTDLGILAGKDANAGNVTGNVDAIKDYSPNVSASLVSASNIAFTLDTVTLNAGIIPPSTTIDVLRIDATHAGLVEGEIASLAFRFDEDGRPLDNTEVNGLIESLSIVSEDRNTIVRVDDLSVDNSGLLRIELPDGDSRVRFLNESKSFFVVVQTGADSINQGGRKFRITHLTDESNAEDERSFVEVTSNDAPATLVGTPDQNATVIAGTEIDIAVTSSVSTPVTGQQVIYTVTVTNQHDTTDASTIPLAGRIPGNLLNVVLTNLQVTGGASSSKSVGESVSGNWIDSLDLPHQGSVTYTFTGTIAELGATDRSMEAEFLISQVSVDLPVEFYDVNSDDNQSLRSDLIRLSSTGTGQFVDSGIDLANLDGNGAVRINELALGDIDGDGDVDAIVTRGEVGAPGYATVLLNDGAGNYTESSQNLGYSNFTGAVLADFDRDGDLDLYLATSTGISGVTDDTDRVYLNDGNGVFTKTVQSFSYLTEAVQLGDTDRDGDLDILISGAGFSHTLRNFGGGIFVPSSRLGVLDNLSQMEFADMDSDGDLDIVGLGNDLRLFLNDGRGFYQSGIRVTGFVTDFELGDLDNDGDVDIMTAMGSLLDSSSFTDDERLLFSLLSFSNDGAGNFALGIVSPPSSFQQIELGDFDNDGDLDAFVIDEIYDGEYEFGVYGGITYGSVYGNNVAVPETVVGKFLSNDGTGVFADSGQSLDYQVELSGELKYSPNELSLTAADINGDGSLDVVTGDFTAAKVWFNNVAPVISVDNSSVRFVQGTAVGNSGLVSDSAYDSLTLSASIGVITDDGDGTWSWSLASANTPGTTVVTVSATDSTGTRTETTFDLVMNVAPVIDASGPSVSVSEGESASHSGTFSDPDSAATPTLTASVGSVNDNGDGTWSWSFNTNDGPDQSQTVTITATDSDGEQTSTSFVLTVNNVAPTVSAANAMVSVDEGQSATNSGSFGDAGLDTVTLTASTGTVTNNGNGTWSWSFNTNDGPDQSQTVTITATDSDGASATTSFALTVNNLAPTVSATSSTVTVDEGQTATNTGSFGDAGLDTVTLTASTGTVTNNGNGTWSWSFNTNDGPDQSQTVTITATDSDGASTTSSFALTVNNVSPTVSAASSAVTVDEGQTATNTGSFGDAGLDVVTLTASTGTVTNNGNGTWSWSFNTNDGPDQSQTVTITATDSDGASTTTSFALTVTNVAPTVSAASSTVTVGEGQTATNTGSFGDAGLDTVTLTASTGTVTNNGNGTWSWSFNTNDGPDQSQTVTIIATDSDGAATTTTFDLVVNNVAPTVSVDVATVTVDEGQTATNNGSFGDVGLDTVTLSVSAGTVTANTNGTWSWSFDTNDGPDQTQTVTITATDSDGAATSATFDLVVDNVAPTAPIDGNEADNTVSEGAANGDSIGLTVSSTDVEDDVVSYSLTNDAGGRFQIDASTGVVTVRDANLLNYESATSHTITIQATDGTDASTSDFTIAVTNVDPYFEAGPNETLLPPVAREFSRAGIQITDPGSPDTFTGVVDFGEPGGDFEPLVIDQARGTFALSHTYTEEGVYTVTVIVYDGGGGQHIDTFEVTAPDGTPPAVTINQATGQNDPTCTPLVNFTVVFSEPVSGFATGDITLSGTAGATLAEVTELAPSDGTTYNVAVSGMASSGTVVASIAAGVVTDAAGNGNTASTSSDNSVGFEVPEFRFDFNSPGSPTQTPGYVGITPTQLYSDESGYGWLTSPSAFDRGASFSPTYADLLRDGHWGSSFRDFQVDLLPCDYEVTVTFGDPSYARDNMSVSVVTGSGGGLVDVDIRAGQLVHRTFAVSTDSAGSLVLRFADAGGDPYWTVAGLEIRPAAAELTVTAPGGSLPADGASEDTFQIDGATAGALYTISSTLGQVVGLDGSPIVDADATYAGLQIEAPSESFSLQLQRPTISGTAVLTVDEVTGQSHGSGDQAYEFSSVRRFDFDTASQDTEPGFWSVGSGNAYDATIGYGWQATAPAFARSSVASSLLSDGHWGTDNTFLVDVPTGDYIVNVTLGDGSFARNYIDVWAEGNKQLDDLTSPAGQFVHASTGLVHVDDGQLTIRIASTGGDPYFVINALEVFAAPRSTLTVTGLSGDETADGTTVDTISVSGTTEGAIYTVSTDLGTIAGVDASTEYAGFQVQAGLSGFTFALQRPTSVGSGIPMIRVEEVTGQKYGELAQQYAMPAVRRFDFNGAANDTESGFQDVRGNTLYTDSRGYGWTQAVPEFQRSSTSLESDALYRDGHWGSAARTFRVQVDPDVNYDVRVYIGDASFARNNIQVSVDGGGTWSTATATAANVFTTVLVENIDPATDELDILIRNNGGDPYWVVNGAEVWEVADTNAVPDPNDPSAANLLSVAGSTEPMAVAPSLTSNQLQPLFDQAMVYWQQEGISGAQLQRLRDVPVHIVDLSHRGALGTTTPEAVWIDDDGAGLGWNVHAVNSASGYHLLSVVKHELGHVIGMKHDDHGVMAPVIASDLRSVGSKTLYVFADLRGSETSPTAGSNFEVPVQAQTGEGPLLESVVDRAVADNVSDAPWLSRDDNEDDEDEILRSIVRQPLDSDAVDEIFAQL